MSRRSIRKRRHRADALNWMGALRRTLAARRLGKAPKSKAPKHAHVFRDTKEIVARSRPCARDLRRYACACGAVVDLPDLAARTRKKAP